MKTFHYLLFSTLSRIRFQPPMHSSDVVSSACVPGVMFLPGSGSESGWGPPDHGGVGLDNEEGLRCCLCRVFIYKKFKLKNMFPLFKCIVLMFMVD